MALTQEERNRANPQIVALADLGFGAHRIAAEFYRRRNWPGMRCGTPLELQVYRAHDAMWGKRYAREAGRAKLAPDLRARYVAAIHAACCEFADEIFGEPSAYSGRRSSGVAVTIQRGDRDSLAYLGGNQAVITYSGRLGPRAMRARLNEELRLCGSLVGHVAAGGAGFARGMTQSLDYLTR